MIIHINGLFKLFGRPDRMLELTYDELPFHAFTGSIVQLANHIHFNSVKISQNWRYLGQDCTRPSFLCNSK